MSSHVTVIAEIGSVHDGSFGNAMKLIDVAAAAGADIAKFQTHIPEAETIHNAPQPPYFKGEPRFEYFKRTGYTLEQWKKLKEHCDEMNIEFLSSPFSIEAVELLEQTGMKRYKIPSGEVTNIPMLERIAQTGKPVILSSGMSSWEELDRAVQAVGGSKTDLTILQCTSEYPCPYENVGMNVLDEMAQRYKCPVGLSDHTLTIFAPIAAVARGATMIEKHLTFSRSMYGSDARTSLEPREFEQMVDGIRAVETMLAHSIDKSDHSRFKNMKDTFEKSVVSIGAIAQGTVITKEMIGIKKPGTGIPAARYAEVIGKTAVRAIEADSVLQDADIA